MKAKVLSSFALIALFAWLSGCGENSGKLAGPETDGQQPFDLLKNGEFDDEDAAADEAASGRKTLIADADSPTQMVVWDPDGFYPPAPFTATNIKVFDDGSARGRMVLGTLSDPIIGRTTFTVRSGAIICNTNLEPVLSLAGTFQNLTPGQKPTKGTFTAQIQRDAIEDDPIWNLDTNGGIPTLSPWETAGSLNFYQNPCIAAPQ
jgi:predicted small lipoprotein YifL